MVGTIARIYGHPVASDCIRPLVLLALGCEGARDATIHMGIKSGTRLAQRAIDQTARKVARRDHRRIGFRLLTRGGQTGEVNLSECLGRTGRQVKTCPRTNAKDRHRRDDSRLLAAVVLFPGWRLPIAFRIGTGIGIEKLQTDINLVSRKAIAGQTPTDNEVRFLYDVYYALATGARLLPTMGPTGRLMAHYLDGSGEPLAIRPRVFLDSGRVQHMADVMRATIRNDHQNGVARARYCSKSFYMPDWRRPGSSFALYYGTLCVDVRRVERNSLELSWKAEVPWEWPSYAMLTKRHGRADSEIVAIPSLRAIVTGNPKARLHLGNGLGHYLSIVGSARAFNAYAEWTDTVPIR